MIAPARRAAFDALFQIGAGRADLGAAVAELRRSLPDERDRALMLELVTGALRMQAAIDYQLASRVSRPLDRLDAAVRVILRLGAYQLMYLTRIPASAVTNDSVDMVRRCGKSSAAGMVNAVLRSLAAERDALAWPPRPAEAASDEGRAQFLTYLATVHSHPAWLVARWLARFGADEVERWLVFNNQASPLTLAANRLLGTRDALATALAGEGVETRATERAPQGLLVISGQPINSAAFREGRCLVQDEASQLISGLVGAQPGWRVLDLCASPGGKTVALCADVGSGGRVVACDVRPQRLRLLAKMLGRCRVTNASIVRVGDAGPLPFADGAFDAALVDAPCSGLGTLRRDPDIRWRRAAADLARLAGVQQDLLARTAGLVRPGGTLVYSTCSSEPEENQGVVDAFLAGHPGYALERTHETWPFRDGLEAFFGAILRRAH